LLGAGSIDALLLIFTAANAARSRDGY